MGMSGKKGADSEMEKRGEKTVVKKRADGHSNQGGTSIAAVGARGGNRSVNYGRRKLGKSRKTGERRDARIAEPQ